jgi:hypothetical protein
MLLFTAASLIFRNAIMQRYRSATGCSTNLNVQTYVRSYSSARG